MAHGFVFDALRSGSFANGNHQHSHAMYQSNGDLTHLQIYQDAQTPLSLVVAPIKHALPLILVCQIELIFRCLHVLMHACTDCYVQAGKRNSAHG
jgi:hypothetical protein